MRSGSAWQSYCGCYRSLECWRRPNVVSLSKFILLEFSRLCDDELQRLLEESKTSGACRCLTTVVCTSYCIKTSDLIKIDFN